MAFSDRTVLFCEHLFVSKVLTCVPQTLIQIFWTHIIYWPTRVVALRHCFAVLHSVAPLSNPFELFICKYPFDFNCKLVQFQMKHLKHSSCSLRHWNLWAIFLPKMQYIFVPLWGHKLLAYIRRVRSVYFSLAIICHNLQTNATWVCKCL